MGILKKKQKKPSPEEQARNLLNKYDLQYDERGKTYIPVLKGTSIPASVEAGLEVGKMGIFNPNSKKLGKAVETLWEEQQQANLQKKADEKKKPDLQQQQLELQKQQAEEKRLADAKAFQEKLEAYKLEQVTTPVTTPSVTSTSDKLKNMKKLSILGRTVYTDIYGKLYDETGTEVTNQDLYFKPAISIPKEYETITESENAPPEFIKDPITGRLIPNPEYEKFYRVKDYFSKTNFNIPPDEDTEGKYALFD